MSSSAQDSTGMRLMSDSEERKFDEANQLARQLCSMSLLTLTSPKSINSSLKKSLESSAVTPTKEKAGLFDGFRRRRLSEKKTVVNGLQMTLSVDDPQQIFNPDAQAAYNQLVASSPPPGKQVDLVQSKAPSNHWLMLHVHSLRSRDALILRNLQQIKAHRQHQYSSLSEYDHGQVNGIAVLPLAFQNANGRSRKPCSGRKQSMSQSDGTTPTTAFRIEMTSSTATSKSILPPCTSFCSSRTETDCSTAADRSASPRPPLPPRVPIRQSTVKNRSRHQRYQLSSYSAAANTSATDSTIPVLQHRNSATSVYNSKQQSASVTLIDRSSRRTVPKPRALVLEPPRQAVRSTATSADHQAVGTALYFSRRGGECQQHHISSVGSKSSDTISSLLLSSSLFDDSSVFATDNNLIDPPPSMPAPLPPQLYVRGIPSRGSQLSALSYHQQQCGRASWSHSATGSSRAGGGKRLRMNTRLVGFHDARDVFCRNPVDFRFVSGAGKSAAASRDADEAEDLKTTLSMAEHDLLDEMYSSAPVVLSYGNSDPVSYEDMMEYALERASRSVRYG